MGGTKQPVLSHLWTLVSSQQFQHVMEITHEKINKVNNDCSCFIKKSIKDKALLDYFQRHMLLCV